MVSVFVTLQPVRVSGFGGGRGLPFGLGPIGSFVLLSRMYMFEIGSHSIPTNFLYGLY